MNKMALLVLSAIGLVAIAGCTAPVDDAGDIDDVEGEVGEAEQALIHIKTVPCALHVPSFGQLEVRVTNNTGVFVFDGEVDYTVYHYGTSATYHQSNLPVGDLANGEVVTFNASNDPNALSASYCTATLTYWY